MTCSVLCRIVLVVSLVVVVVLPVDGGELETLFLSTSPFPFPCLPFLLASPNA